MRILLTGANGQVGHALLERLISIGEVVATTRSGLLDSGEPCERIDLDQIEALQALINRVAPDVVVNAAAYTAVDRAEDEPETAFRANAEVPQALAEACRLRNALLVHYSTDYVFDGQANIPYREDDPTAPLGVYGASKLAGEQAIRESGCRHVIFRTAWVYGHHGSNFMRTMLRLAAQRDELSVVADQIGTPTPAALIAEVTAQVLQHPSEVSGLWHLTAQGQTSWHGFAQAIFQQATRAGLLENQPRVLPITTAQYPRRARRPAYSCLDTSALRNGLGIELPHWREALERVLPVSDR